MKKLNFVGVDVSAKTITMIIDQQGKRTEPLDLPNDARGHKQLIGTITRSRSQARVVLEATGVYSLDLSLALHRADRVEVMVANPRAINQFAEAYMNRGLVYMVLEQYENSIDNYSEAIRVDPLIVYKNYARRAEAIQDLDESIRLDPVLGFAYANLALAFTLLGKDKEAQQDVDRAVELGFDRGLLDSAIENAKKQR